MNAIELNVPPHSSQISTIFQMCPVFTSIIVTLDSFVSSISTPSLILLGVNCLQRQHNSVSGISSPSVSASVKSNESSINI